MTSTVSIIQCRSYDEKEVIKGLRQSIDLIGGIEKFVRSGDRVLLKPNLLYGKSPDKAVTTHPSVVQGIIQIVREAGGIPFIGDSPAVGSLVRAAEKAGIKAVADRMKCPLVEFNRPVLSNKGETAVFKQIEIDQSVFEADVIINLPKFKTHCLTLLTLGIKNLFGCIPGPRKALWHLRAGEDRKVFAQILVDIYRMVQPSLTILDGIIGMDGNGPNSGQPIPIGLVLASNNSLSLDQVVCDLLRISRKSLITNRVAFEQGMGAERIEVVGERLDQLNFPPFRLPNLSQPDWNLPGFLRTALKNALSSKPYVHEKICNGCGRCEEICPPRAIMRREKKLVFDNRQCIRCFCCLEVCPEGAISIKPGWALNLYRQIRNVKSKIV